MAMTTGQKALRQWYGEEGAEAVVKLGLRALAEELLFLEKPTFPQHGAAKRAAFNALFEVSEAKAERIHQETVDLALGH